MKMWFFDSTEIIIVWIKKSTICKSRSNFHFQFSTYDPSWVKLLCTENEIIINKQIRIEKCIQFLSRAV